ncbi:hypothetical protein OB2597_13148 [Pseudooceanicola batsensis HTCC2597]|uniref:Sulfotransferase domain-containing protein n=1 Tax=Pseudooceanicola batsensis (strain ATCC BAA-863 / DSM 15984 / KCTC 12145 / HTCC2597) TaxID=252305 RepID=A3TY58_PSEBH|nr:hypothetical protein [Pseudooceanicola batsensis]EAQ03092.1 hypothetical protein OB2597_13148 [Pseudooceanicola batsensis HTCC2597]
MARLVLHIGTHKTGTTSAQDTFHANRATLAEHGVVYPDLGRHTGHHGLLTDWIALPQAYRLPGGARAALEKLAADWRGTDRTLLLSSEEFSRAGGRGGRVDFNELRRIFSGYELTLICVLRDQKSFLQSVYLELARNGPPPRPPALVSEAMETSQVDGLWCNFNALYSGLRQTFAADEIRLLDYAAVRTAPGGLVSRLMEVICPGTNPEIPVLPPDGWSNVSPGVLPVWAAQVIAAGGPARPHLRRAAQEASDLEFGPDRPQCLFTREESARLDLHFAPSNAALATRLQGDGQHWQLSIPDRPPDTIHREDLGAEFWIRLARRLSYVVQDAA